MEANLVAEPGDPQRASFPYANWGPWLAVLGIPIAIFVGAVLALPGLVFGVGPDGGLSTAGRVIAQVATELGFLLVPLAIALLSGARSPREALSRLGLRPFRRSALGWAALAVLAYFAISLLYGVLVTEPKQENIAGELGSLPLQIGLIVILAPICEETCFRGMLFGGLRQRLPLLAAALLSGLIFGGLHAPEGPTAVPPLVAFGFVLALLYERTGSTGPGILLHMLNNGIALIALHGK